MAGFAALMLAASSGRSSGAGPSSPYDPARFLSPSAAYLYSPPTGPHVDISTAPGIAALRPTLNTGAGGFNYPVQYTDGTHGTTTFDDFGWYQHRDRIAVPNISPGGGFFPSRGGWGADDGHVIIVNSSTGMAYDFWRLCTDATGAPITCPGNRSPTSIGWIGAYNLTTSNAVPGGATASGLTGLAGDILPGELDNGIGHALSVIVPGRMNSTTLCSAVPASHTDGTVPDALFCEGAKIRMDPAVDVAALKASPAAKAVLLALQRYGGIITDQTTCPDCLGFYTALPGPEPPLTGLRRNLLAHLWIYYGR